MFFLILPFLVILMAIWLKVGFEAALNTLFFGVVALIAWVVLVNGVLA